MMNTLRCLILLTMIAPLAAQAQPNPFLYGSVTLHSGKTFTGQLRWDKEEAFWTDMFHASKVRNEHIASLKEHKPIPSAYQFTSNRYRGRRAMSNNNISVQNNRVYRDGEPLRYSTHVLTCQFGELESIENRRGSRPRITFKDGSTMEVSGSGYNDLSPTIRIYSRDEIRVKFEDVARVEFFSAPKYYRSKIGQPLFGKVHSEIGEFEGYIIWDKDERLGIDELDGDVDRREVSIPFEEIRSIRKSGEGSEVSLKSRRKYYLTGSNDVNHGNRGVVVVTPGLGRIEISWKDFYEVTFYDEPAATMLSYDDFSIPTRIVGEVWLRNGTLLKGDLIYDLDESYTYEILDGKISSSELEIPFDAIRSIQPQGSDQSLVRLKSGRELRLRNSQDVTSSNTGILVSGDGRDNLTFVKWREVEKIIFY